MEVTDYDERNIRYFAWNYSCNQAPFEDLVQEGWLAALGAKKPEHKYLAIRRAIQVYKKRATFLQPTAYEQETEKESDELRMIDNLDHLKYLMANTVLSTAEVECLEQIYFGDELTQTELASVSKEKQRTIQKRHERAIKKLRKTAEEESI